MTSGAAQFDEDRASNAMPPSTLFRILKTAAGGSAGEALGAGAATGGPRLGKLSLPGRRPIETPNFFAVTSRGTVPHVTPDNAARYDLFDGAYLALEDFVENIPLEPNRIPPIYKTPESLSPSFTPSSVPPNSPLSRLHNFTSLSPSTVSVLAPRRHLPAASHLGNGPSHISIVTSTGFQKLTLDGYHAAVETLRPDIAVPLADLTFGGGDAAVPVRAGMSVSAGPYPTAKRALRMAERTEDWIDALHREGVAETTGTAIFAPTLPIPYATQWQYLNRLAELAGYQEGGEEEEAAAPPTVSGLAVYDVDLLPDLAADYAGTLARLPRLSLHPARTPHHVLRQIALGADVLLLPSINAASDQGLAFTFSWPPPPSDTSEGEKQQLPLAVDLADPAHKTALAPLSPGCACGTCAAGRHHRAYLHHLLDAREMLAWTLLQVHNYYTVGRFFAGIRATLAAADEDGGGAAAFQAAARRFARAYEPELPAGRATRPRARGYQVKAEAAEPRLNKPAWGRLEDVAAEGEAGNASGAENAATN